MKNMDANKLKAQALRDYAASFRSTGTRTHDSGWDPKTIENAALYAEEMAEELDPTEDTE